jgi:hypothetical protein
VLQYTRKTATVPFEVHALTTRDSKLKRIGPMRAQKPPQFDEQSCDRRTWVKSLNLGRQARPWLKSAIFRGGNNDLPMSQM